MNGSYAQSTIASGLAEPQGIAVVSAGNLYITSLSAGGTIHTLRGSLV